MKAVSLLIAALTIGVLAGCASAPAEEAAPTIDESKVTSTQTGDTAKEAPGSATD